MKSNIQNNYFNLTQIKDKIQNILNAQSKEINELITLISKNENILEQNKIKNIQKNDNNNIINRKENNNFQNFKFENMKIVTIIKCNKGCICCVKTLYDGRLAAGDHYSNLIIYNKETFKPEITIKNYFSVLFNFTQLKNKNIACSFYSDYTLKIIKINDNNEYEDIQIIKNAHNDHISKFWIKK